MDFLAEECFIPTLVWFFISSILLPDFLSKTKFCKETLLQTFAESPLFSRMHKEAQEVAHLKAQVETLKADSREQL